MIRSLVFMLVIVAGLPAAAQMSVTTVGATDAHECYSNASDGYSTQVEPCEQALRDGTLTRRDHNSTLVNRGIIYNRTGDLAAALEDFNQALAKNSSLAEGYLNRGNTYFLMRKINAAINDYEQSLEYGIKKRYVAWYNIGLAHDALKDSEKARAAYQRALEINPEFELAQRKLAPKSRSE